MNNTTLKKKLANNELTIGSWITIGHPSIVEVLSNAGFDWLTVDLEHTTIDLNMAQILISTIQANNMSAMVRISSNEEVVIKRVLDAGADGIIVPMVNDKEDALTAVRSAKYPPDGKRGVGLYRAQKFGLNNGFNEYNEWLNNNVVIIAQIEHIAAVANIQEIITTPGIDGILIGPYDMSGSMGIPGDYNNERVLTAIKDVEEQCRIFNFPFGYHVVTPDSALLAEKINKGYSFLAFATDCLFMGEKVIEEMKNFR